MNKDTYNRLVAKGNTVYKGNPWKGFKKATHGGGIGWCSSCGTRGMMTSVCHSTHHYCKKCWTCKGCIHGGI